jgi:hypothetical protein
MDSNRYIRGGGIATLLFCSVPGEEHTYLSNNIADNGRGTEWLVVKDNTLKSTLSFTAKTLRF